MDESVILAIIIVLIFLGVFPALLWNIVEKGREKTAEERQKREDEKRKLEHEQRKELEQLQTLETERKAEEAKIKNTEQEKIKLDERRIFDSTITFNELTPEISEIIYNKNNKVTAWIHDWRKIKRDKITYYDNGDIIFEAKSMNFKSKGTVNGKCCIQWNINMTSKFLNDLLIDGNIGTVYYGEQTINELLEEIEKQKIEKRLLNNIKRKELENIVKRDLEDRI